MQSSTLSACDLSGSSLVQAQMNNAIMQNTQLKGCNLSYANLSNAVMSYTDFSNSDLSSTNLHAIIDHGAVWSGCNKFRTLKTDEKRERAELWKPAGPKTSKV
jgi:uncharacterized protein YjbI with pentapeptide repeats